MVDVRCNNGKDIICLDKKDPSSSCCESPKTCGWAKYSDIMYRFRTVETHDGSGVYIPLNAVGINTSNDSVSWLEPCNKQKK